MLNPSVSDITILGGSFGCAFGIMFLPRRVSETCSHDDGKESGLVVSRCCWKIDMAWNSVVMSADTGHVRTWALGLGCAGGLCSGER